MDNALTKTVCSPNMCTGCMACVNVCNKGAIEVRDNIDSHEPVIDAGKCVDCGLCTKACPNNFPRELKATIFSRQGWAEDSTRFNSSSGGAAAVLIKNFISSGGHAASCMFRDGEFKFVITSDPDEAKGFAGSKYVKSDPKLIYREIRELLAEGAKVLFIGLPCQVAAALNVCGDADNLYTADLICHGTPSLKILRMYLEENGIDLDKAKDVRFRKDNEFGLTIDGLRLTPVNVPDHYTYAFLKSVDYTENCYSCRYASLKRVSDITLGDAWGQMSDNDSKGVSLILCQSEKGKALVENAGLKLFDVDMAKAAEANTQLRRPSEKPAARDVFLNQIKKGSGVTAAVQKAFPLFKVKNSVKSVLNKRRHGS